MSRSGGPWFHTHRAWRCKPLTVRCVALPSAARPGGDGMGCNTYYIDVDDFDFFSEKRDSAAKKSSPGPSAPIIKDNPVSRCPTA